VIRWLRLLPLTLLCTAAFAQTATFTWNGNTDTNSLTEFATIDGSSVNQATGYAGAIQIDNQNILWLLELPETFNFPNNGFLDCESSIAFGPKQWGTRVDGTPMNGAQAGDWYTITGTTSCPLWNGTTNVSLTELRMIVAHHSCIRYRCHTYLTDTAQSGTGTAMVE
jgi:hypothetical protein